MKVLAEYSTHHYFHEYTQTALYCPQCGSMNAVWSEDGPGDYYCGETHLCTHCRCQFTIQGPSDPGDVYSKVIDQIKSGQTFEPKTTKGN